MASRASLNKVLLIGNLTRDPELRYTPQGNAVCTFGLATNRSWQPADGGERKEETEFHRLVAWNKLGELCSQLLAKGRKVYVEGRLQTRQWQAPDGAQRQVTEIVIDDMRILDSRRPDEKVGDISDIADLDVPAEDVAHPVETVSEGDEKIDDKGKVKKGSKKEPASDGQSESASPDPLRREASGSLDGDKKAEVSEEDEDDILKDLPF